MKLAQNFYDIFMATTRKYHETDDVDALVGNPYAEGTIEHTLFAKNWIDAVQWHLEDIIRDPNIDPVDALALKRRIDRSNQDRTDMVEEIDTYFREKYADVTPRPEATINTESPPVEVARPDASPEHKAKCEAKLNILLQQQVDLTTAIDTLLDDIAAGTKYMKVYRQMKMYNDPATNPVLYKK